MIINYTSRSDQSTTDAAPEDPFRVYWKCEQNQSTRSGRANQKRRNVETHGFCFSAVREWLNWQFFFYSL